MSFRACTVSGVYHYLSFFGRVPNLLNNVHLDWWWCPPHHSALQLYGSLPEEFWSLLRRTEVQQEINRGIWDHVSKTTPFNISLWELCQNPIVFRARKLHISSASILMFSRSETIGFCVARFLFSERFIGTFVLSFFVYLCKKTQISLTCAISGLSFLSLNSVSKRQESFTTSEAFTSGV